MRFSTILTGLVATLWATSTSASPVEKEKRDFGPSTIFSPPSTYTNPRTLYARSLQLADGTLLSTWENYDWTGKNQPYFPIYQSTDHGITWKQISKVYDTVNGWGLRYQPMMYLLPTAMGGYPAGSILLAGNSIPGDLSKTQLDLYVSTNKGVSWTFVSHIASGGKALPNNGLTPVWEPFLMVYNNQLVCYYSDQRDPKHGQKLVHQTTTDLKTWGSVVTDFAASAYDRRPGMPIVSKMGDGNYFLTYEDGGAPAGNFAVYTKISSNPLNFGAVSPVALVTTDGYTPEGSPYNVFTTVGSSKGTVVVNAASDSDFFINHNYGVGSWTRITTQSPSAYSRSLAVGYNPKDILIVSGGKLGVNNTVTSSARDVNGCATCS